MNTLYEKLGGKDSINVAVDKFYEKVLNDSRIKIFFESVDMKKQKSKQKAFLTYVFGGPNLYKGLNMKDGHKHLVEKGLNDSHVDAVIELLGETLNELKVPDSDINEARGIAESVRDQVLGRA